MQLNSLDTSDRSATTVAGIVQETQQSNDKKSKHIVSIIALISSLMVMLSLYFFLGENDDVHESIITDTNHEMISNPNQLEEKVWFKKHGSPFNNYNNINFGNSRIENMESSIINLKKSYPSISPNEKTQQLENIKLAKQHFNYFENNPKEKYSGDYNNYNKQNKKNNYKQNKKLRNSKMKKNNIYDGAIDGPPAGSKPKQGLKGNSVNHNVKIASNFDYSRIRIPDISNIVIKNDSLIISENFAATCDNYLNYDNNVKEYDFINDKCVILNTKGLPKSGTTWLETTLDVIYDLVCNKSNFSLALCNVGRSLHCTKHQMRSYESVGCYYGYVIPFERWCEFVTFRDPRNRIVSTFMTTKHYKDKSAEALNTFVKKSFGSYVTKLAQWWKFFQIQQNTERKNSLEYKQAIENGNVKQIEVKVKNLDKNKDGAVRSHDQFQVINGELSKLHTFMYYYEDFLLKPHEMLCSMIHFMGFNDILDINDLEYIYQTVVWDNQSKDKNANSKYHTKRSKFNREKNSNNVVDLCKFKKYMTSESVETVHEKMKTIETMLPNVYQSLNQRCPIG